MPKINERGEYQTFRGVTVICPLVTDISDYYSLLSEETSSMGRSAILPLDSMHMTLKNLWTEHDYPSYDAYIRDMDDKVRHLHTMNRRLKQIRTSIHMRMSKHYVRGILLAPESYDDDITITNYEGIVDSTPLGRFDVVKKHMTFSYDYNTKVAPYTSNVDAGILSDLTFGPPIVCTFDSMKSYEPI